MSILNEICTIHERVVVKFNQSLSIQGQIKVNKDQLVKADYVTEIDSDNDYVLIDFEEQGKVKVPVSEINSLFEIIRLTDDKQIWAAFYNSDFKKKGGNNEDNNN